MTGRLFLAPLTAIAFFAVASSALSETVTLVCGDQVHYDTIVVDFDKKTLRWKNTNVCPETWHDVSAQITEDAIHFDEHFDLQGCAPDPDSWYAITIDRTTGAEAGIVCTTKSGCTTHTHFDPCRKQERQF